MKASFHVVEAHGIQVKDRLRQINSQLQLDTYQNVALVSETPLHSTLYFEQLECWCTHQHEWYRKAEALTSSRYRHRRCYRVSGKSGQCIRSCSRASSKFQSPLFSRSWYRGWKCLACRWWFYSRRPLQRRSSRCVKPRTTIGQIIITNTLLRRSLWIHRSVHILLDRGHFHRWAGQRNSIICWCLSLGFCHTR